MDRKNQPLVNVHAGKDGEEVKKTGRETGAADLEGKRRKKPRALERAKGPSRKIEGKRTRGGKVTESMERQPKCPCANCLFGSMIGNV